MNSRRFLTGSLSLIAITLGTSATGATGTKSLIGSKGRSLEIQRAIAAVPTLTITSV